MTSIPKQKITTKRLSRFSKNSLGRSAPVHHEWQEKMRARTELVSYLRFLSPAIVVQLALEDVAGSGTVRHQRFDEQVDDFYDRFRAFFFKKVEGGSRHVKADIDGIPSLRFEEEDPPSAGSEGFDRGIRYLFAVHHSRDDSQTQVETHWASGELGAQSI